MEGATQRVTQPAKTEGHAPLNGAIISTISKQRTGGCCRKVQQNSPALKFELSVKKIFFPPFTGNINI